MEINNSKLVDLFGTDSNKDRYLKTLKVDNGLKTTLLNRAKSEYEIVNDLGRGRYIIDGKREYSLNKNTVKMLQESIYYNLTPIILNRVKTEYCNSSVFLLSLIDSYSCFDIVNKTNYNNIRYNKVTCSNQLNLNVNTTTEYFNIVNKSLRYYFEHCLNILQKEYVIEYQKIKYLKERHIKTRHESDEINGNVRTTYRRATVDELQLDLDIKRKIMNILNLKDEECENSKEFKSRYYNELSSYGISYFYDCYEVVCSNLNKINYILSLYKDINLYELSIEFSKIFESLTISNANSRQNSSTDKLYRLDSKYISDYLFLTSNTLYKNAKVLDLKGLTPEVQIIGNQYNYSYIIKENN